MPKLAGGSWGAMVGASLALALRAGILCLNVESAGELDRIEQVAAGLGLRAPISLRRYDFGAEVV